MSGRAALALALAGWVALLVGGGCESEPVQPSGVAGTAGSESAGPEPAPGGAGGQASTPAPEGCPQVDWGELDGKPCDPALDRAHCVKIGECASPSAMYRDEKLYCFPTLDTPTRHEWADVFDEGSCDTRDIVLGPDGCPEGNWSDAYRLPCPEEGVECSSGFDDCDTAGGFYYSESISCFDRRWFWGFDEGECCEESAGGAGSDCG